MNIIVTGASRGIGFETVFELTGDPGNRIIAMSRNRDGLAALQKKCSATSNNVITCEADIAQLDEKEIHTIIAPYGHIDILVNNAGILINKKFADLEMEEWK